MGHQMILLNNHDKEVRRISFSPWDFNSKYFYDLFDAQIYNEGMNGWGGIVQYKKEQMELAYYRFKKIREYSFIYNHEAMEEKRRREVDAFIQDGLEIAKKDGIVKINYR